MSANSTRALVLVRALRAGAAGDSSVIGELYTDDVQGWGPVRSVSSADDLAAAFTDTDRAFTIDEIEVQPFDVGGDFAVAEWRATMTHSGPLVLSAEHTIEPTGWQVFLHGATVAEFRGDRICSFRQYWNDHTILEQLGLLRDDE